MTNFEHVLKTIDPEVLKNILASKIAVMKETGEIYECDICLNKCKECIFNDYCLHRKGNKGTKDWLNQEYTEPETTKVVITSGDISW